MENEELISVIVPVYNAGEYLSNCVLSLIQQSYKHFELILVDDGSTDESPANCDTWAETDSRIKVIHQENKGAAAARNMGVAAAKGDYIAFVDSDDTVDEHYLGFMYLRLKANAADAVICGYRKVYPSKGIEAEEASKRYTERIMTGVEAMEDLLYQRGFMSVPWGCLSSRSLWDMVSFPEGRRAEDVATIYRLYAAADTVVYNDRPLYNYFQRKTSTIYSTSFEKNRDYLRNSREIIRFVGKYYPKSVRSAYSRHFSTCFQILSETTSNRKNRRLVNMAYEDIRKLQNTVLKDKNARLKNRGAAAISLVSVRLLHGGLRVVDIISRSRL